MLRTRRRSRPSFGSELVSNGRAFTATTGWTPTAGCTLSVASGELVFTIAALASFPGATTQVTVVPGKFYRVTVTGRRGTSTDLLGANFNTGFTPGYNGAVSHLTTNLTVSFIFQATATTADLILFASAGSSAAGTLILNSISCKLVSP